MLHLWSHHIVNTYSYCFQGLGDLSVLELLLTCVGHHLYEVRSCHQKFNHAAFVTKNELDGGKSNGHYTVCVHILVHLKFCRM